jgi:micrococcal nuclease
MASRLLALVGGFLLALTVSADEPEALTAMVTHVIDGNTVEIKFRGQERPQAVRLIGLIAPKKSTRDLDGQEPWGTRSQQWLALQIARKEVKVELDLLRSVKGQAGVVWGYVWLGDKLLNEESLKEGHSVLATEVPNVKHAEKFQAAQKVAREGGKGVRNMDRPLDEEPAKFIAKKQEAKAEATAKEDKLKLDKFKEGCVVGNTKTKKYHVPGGQYYASTQGSKNAIFFANEDDAKKAGYQKSSR